MRAALIAAGVALIFWYAVWGRDWMKTTPWGQRFLSVIEPLEIKLYRKSQVLLLARFKMLVGVSLTLCTYLGTIDLTPIMPFVPDQYEATVKNLFNLLPMTVTLLGMIEENMRNKTTQPVDLVAVADKDMTPRIKEAIALADSTKTEAVAVVKANGGT